MKWFHESALPSPSVVALARDRDRDARDRRRPRVPVRCTAGLAVSRRSCDGRVIDDRVMDGYRIMPRTPTSGEVAQRAVAAFVVVHQRTGAVYSVLRIATGTGSATRFGLFCDCCRISCSEVQAVAKAFPDPDDDPPSGIAIALKAIAA
jgi:hypothetical protein